MCCPASIVCFPFLPFASLIALVFFKSPQLFCKRESVYSKLVGALMSLLPLPPPFGWYRNVFVCFIRNHFFLLLYLSPCSQMISSYFEFCRSVIYEPWFCWLILFLYLIPPSNDSNAFFSCVCLHFHFRCPCFDRFETPDEYV